MEQQRPARAWVPEGVPSPYTANRTAPRHADRSRNRPLRWSQRYQIILHRHLAGRRAIEIAAELRYSPHRVSMIVNSPLFQERKAGLLRELSGDARAQFLDDIRRDAVPNFEFLCSLREDEALPARTRLRAAQVIADQLDRLLPHGGRQ